MLPVFGISTTAQAQLPATHVLGQSVPPGGNPLFTQGLPNNGGTTTSNLGFNSPSYTALDTVNHRLFVSDTQNNRVLVFLLNNDNTPQDLVADYVIGQPNFTSNTALNPPTSDSLNSPTALLLVTGNLYVADTGNNRVLRYSVGTLSNGLAANGVWGRSSGSTVVCNYTTNTPYLSKGGMNAPQGLAYETATKHLLVADTGNHRILTFNTGDGFQCGELPDHVIGQGSYITGTPGTTATKFNSPRGMVYDPLNERLFIADTLNHRIVEHQLYSRFVSNYILQLQSDVLLESAENVLGQNDFTSGQPNKGSTVSQSGLNLPTDVRYDPVRQWLYVADSGNHRVLGFSVKQNRSTNGEDAILLFGQANYTQSNTTPIDADSLNTPKGLEYDSTNFRLITVDSGNHRTLWHLLPRMTTLQLASATDGVIIAGESYNETINATGGEGNYTFSVISGSLPPGLSISGNAIAGTPTTPGIYCFTIRLQDQHNLIDEKDYYLHVRPATITSTGGQFITTPFLTTGIKGYTYGLRLTASGGVPPYRWKATGLPQNFRLDSCSGRIESPHIPVPVTAYPIQITVVDLHNVPAAPVGMSLSVGAAANSYCRAITTEVPDGLKNQGYLYYIDVVACQWVDLSIDQNPPLPSGLQLIDYATNPLDPVWSSPPFSNKEKVKELTGIIRGTPTQTTGIFPFTFTLRVTPHHSCPTNCYDDFSLNPMFMFVTDNDVTSPVITNVSSSGITTTSATITWTTNEASDSQVEYGTTTSYGNSSTLNPSLVTSHSTDLTGLLPATLYHYRVKSRDAAGNLATSSDFTFTTATPPGPVVTTTTLSNGTVGGSYNQTLAASGGTSPLTWSITAGSLPGGLSLNNTTGIISGTPTTAGTSNFTVRVTDANSAFDDQALSIVVNAAPVITTTTLPNGTVSGAYNQTLVATGGTPPLTWSVTAGSLPAGLSLNSSTGVVSGTPTGVGSFSFTVLAMDANGVFDDQTLSIVVNAAPVITTTALSNGILGGAYSQTLTATGGTAPLTWSVTAGSLPAGLSLNSSTGVVSGTPTTAGTSNFTVRVTDANSSSDDQTLSIVINEGLTITTTSLPGATLTVTYSQTLAAIGGTAPLSWSLAPGSGPLPDGLTLSTAGVISGTPTTAGTFNFTVRVTDANSAFDDQALSIVVNAAPVITTTTLPNGTVSGAYNQTLVATGGTPPLTWSVTTGSLPAGLSLNSSTGVVSGTPTTAGTSNFTVRVTDANSAFDDQALSITTLSGTPPTAPNLVAIPVSTSQIDLTWTSSTDPSGIQRYEIRRCQGTGCTPVFLANRPPTTTQFPDFGLAQGTTYTYTVVAFNNIGLFTSSNTVEATTLVPTPLSMTTTSLPNGAQGVLYSVDLRASGGMPPYTWTTISVSSDFPGTLSIPSDTPDQDADIVGTPDIFGGPFSITIRVTDSSSPQQIVERDFQFSIAPSNSLAITTTSLPRGFVLIDSNNNITKGTDYFAQIEANEQGQTPYTWSIVSGSLPFGLNLVSDSVTNRGVITGRTDPFNTSPGIYNFTVQVMDTQGKKATQPLSIEIQTYLQGTDVTLLAPDLEKAILGRSYTSVLLQAEPQDPVTQREFDWFVAVGELPPGLAITVDSQDQRKATLTGIPGGVPKIYPFTLGVRGKHHGETATAALTLVVDFLCGNGRLQITSPDPSMAAVGTGYTKRLSASKNGNSSPQTTLSNLQWTVCDGTLPEGLILDSSTGETAVISGKPTTPSTDSDRSITVKAQDPTTLDSGEIRFEIVTINRPGNPPGNLDIRTPASKRRVDGFDLGILKRAFGGTSQNHRWNAAADLNNDGKIDGSDLTILAPNFGKVAP